jgi:penicillin-binding protein-related factor A (putative recombinase)
MTIKGRALENAISKGFAFYRKRNRADGKKLATPMRYLRGKWRHVETSGSDFEGVEAGGRALVIEAKETAETSFPLSKLSENEREYLTERHRFGARALLVIDFTELCETYAISWEHVAMFLANPWRESLSLDWCRAFGQLVPNADGVCLFLDGVPHIASSECMAAVEAEKARPRQAKLLDAPKKISAKQREFRERLNRPSPKTPAEARARILEAADAGMRRVAKGGRK